MTFPAFSLITAEDLPPGQEEEVEKMTSIINGPDSVKAEDSEFCVSFFKKF